MAESKAFITWFIEQLPEFLMQQPICYFVGFAMLAYTVKIVKDLINL